MLCFPIEVHRELTALEPFIGPTNLRGTEVISCAGIRNILYSMNPHFDNFRILGLQLTAILSSVYLHQSTLLTASQFCRGCSRYTARIKRLALVSRL